MSGKSFDLSEFLLVNEDNPLRYQDAATSEHVRLWLDYRAGGGVEDFDNTDGAKEFYRLLWSRLLDHLDMHVRPEGDTGTPSQYVQGDWMCSVWTTLKRGLQIQYGTNSWWRKTSIENTFGAKGKVTERTFRGILTHYDEFTTVLDNPYLKAFLRSAYTLANLIVVPDGFNSARVLPTGDYWDKTLSLYFTQGNQLNYKGVDVSRPFRRLIQASIESDDALFLRHWLNEQGQAIMLPKTPHSLKEWQELLHEMTERIHARRSAMYTVLANL